MSSSFYPATIGRVSSSQSISRLLFQVHHDQGAIQKLQTQLSTGRRIERASEDPAAAIRALAAQRSLEFKGQVLNNLKSANTILGASESMLSQAQSILNEMRGIAIESSGNLLSEAERDANSNQVREAIKKLVELGNSKFRDQHVFAGADVMQPPLQILGNSIRFSGTDNQLNTITDIGATLAANVTADEAFGTRSNHIVGSVDLNPSLHPLSPLSDLNDGEGMRRGSIALTDGINRTEIDLTGAYNIQDVVNAIQAQQLGTRDISVSIGPNNISVTYQDGLGGILRVEEVGSGLTAADLGIRTTLAASTSPVVGTDLKLKTTEQTQLSQLFGGSGIANGSLFTIRQNNRDYLVNTAGMTKVEDLINGIEASGARVQAALDPSGKYFSIQSTESGTSLSIGEAGGTLATQLGVRTFDSTTPVSRLNFGQGIFQSDVAQDLRIRRTDGTELVVELDGVQTVGDVITRINSHVNNFTPSLRVVASLSTNGNGLVLSAPTGAQPIEITNGGGSQAATGLGLVPAGQSSVVGTTAGLQSVITGLDVSGIEVEGAFTTLLRLEDAVRIGSSADMERLVGALDDDIRRMSMARGLVGARQQTIEHIQTRTEDQQIQLKEVESNEIDTDLASVISELTSRQAALEASLQLMGSSSRLSLFDYL
ncbi:MAG: hypothetical protein IT423_21825 [Pirellulaceae bacterium]|nr:hypothetical protein [Pirellulaceae bacterium]